MRLYLLSLILLSCLLLSACTTVKPWEKEHFAEWHMQFEPEPLEAKFKQHVYESKEGSFGGYGVGGGGCGCGG